jgi:flagellar biosynthesis protein
MSDRTKPNPLSAPGSPLAAALSYRPGEDPAPRVVAKGRGPVADRIAALAERHRVPLHRDPDLAQLLMTMDLGEEIPVEAFTVVAEILAFLFRANGTLAALDPHGRSDP